MRWKLTQIWPYLLEGIDVKFSKAVAEEIEKQICQMINLSEVIVSHVKLDENNFNEFNGYVWLYKKK